MSITIHLFRASHPRNWSHEAQRVLGLTRFQHFRKQIFAGSVYSLAYRRKKTWKTQCTFHHIWASWNLLLFDVWLESCHILPAPRSGWNMFFNRIWQDENPPILCLKSEHIDFRNRAKSPKRTVTGHHCSPGWTILRLLSQQRWMVGNCEICQHIRVAFD